MDKVIELSKKFLDGEINEQTYYWGLMAELHGIHFSGQLSVIAQLIAQDLHVKYPE